MKFFEPQVSLYKHIYIDGANEYYLHVITFTNRSGMKAEQVFLDDSKVNTEKVISITLTASDENHTVDIECIQPVTHTIALGNEITEDITFNISFKVEGTETIYMSSRPKPKPVILSRPIGEDTVEAAWKENFGVELL
jgi:hypothetical protein